MKGVAKSFAMNGLGKLVDDIANFRIINLDCGNWSICLFHKLFSSELVCSDVYENTEENFSGRNIFGR